MVMMNDDDGAKVVTKVRKILSVDSILSQSNPVSPSRIFCKGFVTHMFIFQNTVMWWPQR